MASKATITVLKPRSEVERLWSSSEHRAGGAVSFRDAPGDRGTEIHVDLEQPGKAGEMVAKVAGKDPRAKAMDDLRRFKQHVETGEIARSDATPEGESLEAKGSQRPAQPVGA